MLPLRGLFMSTKTVPLSGEILLTRLVSAHPEERMALCESLLSLSDPLTMVMAAFEKFDQTAKEAYLLHALSLLESWGSRAWPALLWVARSPRPESELFTGLIARCEGVSEEERIEALRHLATHPAASVRWGVFERLSAFPRERARSILQQLLQDPDGQIRAEAAERLECLA
jgi:hypothetical protein